MRLPRVFDRRRRRYEELVTEHLDGVLDAAGEARLQTVLDGDPALALEARELEAVTAALRAEPLVEPPRSFALPYAPARVPEPPRAGTLRSGTLGWMQAATATAALVLVTLIGVDLVVAPAGGRVGVSQVPEASAATPSAAPSEEAPAAFQAAPPPDAPATDSAFGVPEPSAAPSEEAPLAFQAAPPPDAPALDDAASDGIERAPVEDRALAREPEPAPVAPPATGRSALDWAQLGLGVLTATLALGVALLSWRAARRRA